MILSKIVFENPHLTMITPKTIVMGVFKNSFWENIIKSDFQRKVFSKPSLKA